MRAALLAEVLGAAVHERFNLDALWRRAAGSLAPSSSRSEDNVRSRLWWARWRRRCDGTCTVMARASSVRNGPLTGG